MTARRSQPPAIAKTRLAADPDGPRLSLHDYYPGVNTRAASYDDASVTAFAGDCSDALEGFIGAFDSVVGCVAWVREPRILALLTKRATCLILNKESHWKGAEGKRSLNSKVTSAYGNALRTESGLTTAMFPGLLSDVHERYGAAQGDLAIPRFACVGFSKTTPFRPLLHSKVLVGGSLIAKNDVVTFEPQATWLGSFNFSKVASGNAESAVIIGSVDVARFYLHEWALWLGVAEPLAWTSATPKPGALLRSLKVARHDDLLDAQGAA